MTKLQIATVDVELAEATQASYDEAFVLIAYATEREFTAATRMSRHAAMWGLYRFRWSLGSALFSGWGGGASDHQGGRDDDLPVADRLPGQSPEGSRDGELRHRGGVLPDRGEVDRGQARQSAVVVPND